MKTVTTPPTRLATQGHRVNRKRVQRLMRLLGLVAIYRRPNTSEPAEVHKIYPPAIQQFLRNNPTIATVSLYLAGIGGCERVRDLR